jgi:hypothetical protein
MAKCKHPESIGRKQESTELRRRRQAAKANKSGRDLAPPQNVQEIETRKEARGEVQEERDKKLDAGGKS